MRKLRGAAWGALAVIAVAVVIWATGLHVVLLRAAGHVLIAEDPLERADVVAIPFWAGRDGVLTAADLIRGGYAPRALFLAHPRTTAERELVRRGVTDEDDGASYRRLLHTLGVADVQELDGGPGSNAEAYALATLAPANGFRTVIMLSTPDHSWRVRRQLDRSLKGRATKAIVRMTRFSDFDPDRWWQSRDGVRTELVEMEKLLVDLVSHPIS